MSDSDVAGQLIGVIEAASRCGLSVSTMNKLRLAGTGPRYAKLGRAIRYRIADLDRWVTAHLRCSTSEAA